MEGDQPSDKNEEARCLGNTPFGLHKKKRGSLPLCRPRMIPFHSTLLPLRDR